MVANVWLFISKIREYCYFFRLVIDFFVRLYIFFTIDIFGASLFLIPHYLAKKKERKKAKTVLANVHDINLNMNKE